MFRSFALLPLLALSATALAQTTPVERNAALNAPLPADQAAMKAHVMFLASDAMKGRDVGSPEFDIAAQYVAAQFYAAGLKPKGDDGGYLQKVPLTGYKIAGEGVHRGPRRAGPAPRWRSARTSPRRPIRRRRRPRSPRRWCSSAMGWRRRNMG
ncbi:hypothetical protein QP166_00695 [Sphingomonas sp. LR60]|uniref:hypothetical protein n=1 Tax=Sphingomonas sp. LR60 TaxID=3050233 RepID=UPI002FE1ED7D